MAPRFEACGGLQMDSMAVLSYRPVSDRKPWTKIADVEVANDYGPHDCSYKGFPEVALADGNGEELPTIGSRAGDFPEAWVDLLWTRNPDYAKQCRNCLAHFRVYTTELDSNGHPCPRDRMVVGLSIEVTFPGAGKHYQTASNSDSNTISSCDGRIAVTALVQLVW